MSRDDEDEGFSVEDVKCIHVTADALKCVTSTGTGFLKAGKPFWVPQSQVHENSEVYRDQDEGVLVVKSWYAEKEGWSDE